MTYYVGLSGTGKRTKVTHFVYEQLLAVHGYIHVIREQAFEVIRAEVTK